MSYTYTVGPDIVGSSYIINHNLDTEDVLVQIRDVNTKKEVQVETTIVDENTVRLYPTQEQEVLTLKVIIIGIK